MFKLFVITENGKEKYIDSKIVVLNTLCSDNMGIFMWVSFRLVYIWLRHFGLIYGKLEESIRWLKLKNNKNVIKEDCNKIKIILSLFKNTKILTVRRVI